MYDIPSLEIKFEISGNITMLFSHICNTNVLRLSWSIKCIPLSYLTTRFSTNVPRWVSLVEQNLLSFTWPFQWNLFCSFSLLLIPSTDHLQKVQDQFSVWCFVDLFFLLNIFILVIVLSNFFLKNFFVYCGYKKEYSYYRYKLSMTS